MDYWKKFSFTHDKKEFLRLRVPNEICTERSFEDVAEWAFRAYRCRMEYGVGLFYMIRGKLRGLEQLTQPLLKDICREMSTGKHQTVVFLVDKAPRTQFFRELYFRPMHLFTRDINHIYDEIPRETDTEYNSQVLEEENIRLACEELAIDETFKTFLEDLEQKQQRIKEASRRSLDIQARILVPYGMDRADIGLEALGEDAFIPELPAPDCAEEFYDAPCTAEENKCDTHDIIKEDARAVAADHFVDALFDFPHWCDCISCQPVEDVVEDIVSQTVEDEELAELLNRWDGPRSTWKNEDADEETQWSTSKYIIDEVLTLQNQTLLEKVQRTWSQMEYNLSMCEATSTDIRGLNMEKMGSDEEEWVRSVVRGLIPSKTKKNKPMNKTERKSSKVKCCGTRCRRSIGSRSPVKKTKSQTTQTYTKEKRPKKETEDKERKNKNKKKMKNHRVQTDLPPKTSSVEQSSNTMQMDIKQVDSKVQTAASAIDIGLFQRRSREIGRSAAEQQTDIAYPCHILMEGALRYYGVVSPNNSHVFKKRLITSAITNSHLLEARLSPNTAGISAQVTPGDNNNLLVTIYLTGSPLEDFYFSLDLLLEGEKIMQSISIHIAADSVKKHDCRPWKEDRSMNSSLHTAADVDKVSGVCKDIHTETDLMNCSTHTAISSEDETKCEIKSADFFFQPPTLSCVVSTAIRPQMVDVMTCSTHTAVEPEDQSEVMSCSVHTAIEPEEKKCAMLALEYYFQATPVDVWKSSTATNFGCEDAFEKESCEVNTVDLHFEPSVMTSSTSTAIAIDEESESDQCEMRTLDFYFKPATTDVMTSSTATAIASEEVNDSTVCEMRTLTYYFKPVDTMTCSTATAIAPEEVTESDNCEMTTFDYHLKSDEMTSSTSTAIAPEEIAENDKCEMHTLDYYFKPAEAMTSSTATAIASDETEKLKYEMRTLDFYFKPASSAMNCSTHTALASDEETASEVMTCSVHTACEAAPHEFQHLVYQKLAAGQTVMEAVGSNVTKCQAETDEEEDYDKASIPAQTDSVSDDTGSCDEWEVEDGEIHVETEECSGDEFEVVKE